MKLIVPALVASLLFTNIAHAYDDEHYTNLSIQNIYIAIAGGTLYPSQNSRYHANSNIITYAPTPNNTGEFYLANVNWHNDYRDGYQASVALGGNLYPCLRIEAEVLYQNMKRHVNGAYTWKEIVPESGDSFATQLNDPVSAVSNRANLYYLFANAMFDYRNHTPWTPAIGFGLGGAWLRSASMHAHNMLQLHDLNANTTIAVPVMTQSPALNGSAFAWQFKVGVDYDITCHLSVTAQYHLTGTSNFRVEPSTITVNPGTAGQAIFSLPAKNVRGVLNNGFDLGMRYIFA